MPRPPRRRGARERHIRQLIDDLVATIRAANGAGLAATQIGAGLRICVIEVDNNPRYPYKPQIPLTILVNPVITALTDETFANNEGCLSVPGLRGTVDRLTEIRVTAHNRAGTPLDFAVRGLSAGTYQHECDHLDGLLFLDRVTDPTTLTTWDNFERYHRPAYIGKALPRSFTALRPIGRRSAPLPAHPNRCHAPEREQ